MKKLETLAQLICRTVLEFEQRQATIDSPQDKSLENISQSPNIQAFKPTISKKNKSKNPKSKNQTA